jgi:hypothetical protein
VGCWIPDELYDPTMEDCSARHLIEKGWIPNVNFNNAGLVNHLQSIHDNWNVDKWEERLQITAHEFNLKYTPPESSV